MQDKEVEISAMSTVTLKAAYPPTYSYCKNLMLIISDIRLKNTHHIFSEFVLSFNEQKCLFCFFFLNKTLNGDWCAHGTSQ